MQDECGLRQLEIACENWGLVIGDHMPGGIPNDSRSRLNFAGEIRAWVIVRGDVAENHQAMAPRQRRSPTKATRLLQS
jgi:hypothetical protein